MSLWCHTQYPVKIVQILNIGLVALWSQELLYLRPYLYSLGNKQDLPISIILKKQILSSFQEEKSSNFLGSHWTIIVLRVLALFSSNKPSCFNQLRHNPISKNTPIGGGRSWPRLALHVGQNQQRLVKNQDHTNGRLWSQVISKTLPTGI